MTDYWFYHLEASTLKGVLPGLLEKTLQKGWRALVKLPEAELADMDAYLWTFQDDSFLPHGRDDEPQSAQQPIRRTLGRLRFQIRVIAAVCGLLLAPKMLNYFRYARVMRTGLVNIWSFVTVCEEPFASCLCI